MRLLWLRSFGRNEVIASGPTFPDPTTFSDAMEIVKKYGLKAYVIADNVQGDEEETANFILNTVEKYKKNIGKVPICLLFGGEPTIKVMGNGLGGRNQHLALYLATKLENNPGITILCGGTDGTDGPTDVAGAIVDYKTMKKQRKIDSENVEYFGIHPKITTFECF